MLGENPRQSGFQLRVFSTPLARRRKGLARGIILLSLERERRFLSLFLFVTNKCVHQLNRERAEGLHASFFENEAGGIVGRGGARGRMTETFLLF